MKPFLRELYNSPILPHAVGSSAASRSTVCTSESHMDIAAFSRATAEIYYIKEGGKDEQIEGGKGLRGGEIKLRVG